MSGKGSRARRVVAVRAARWAVYANNGSEMAGNPFTDERQARIYAKAYAITRAHYWRMESLLSEMEEVYGAIPYRVTAKGRAMLEGK